mmetsp:Transcript_18618/g.56198  ORF Transcript_18618/g.56198 Transcript_18618/m.56198 type:complete len:300 (+) Transcript_18618:941-1840(+)
MASSSFTSSTSLRVGTTSRGMVCRMAVKRLRASPNLPSVTLRYARFSSSSRPARLNTRAGAVGGTEPASPFQLRSRDATVGGRPGRAGRMACAPAATCRKYGCIGSKLASPSCLCSRRIADAKSPAAACSAASPHFCSHLPEGGTPGGGATKGVAVSPKPAPPTGVAGSAGSSRSSISQPPSSSSPESPTTSSTPSWSVARASTPSRSSPSSAPQAAPTPSSMSSSSMSAAGAPPTSCCARFSKKPLLTVSSGQLSSRKIGVGGISSKASPPTWGRLPSPISSASAAASSSMPCVFAVT